MPSEHEPIDATVKDGVARAELPREEAPSRPASARSPGSMFGCLVMPALMGLLLIGVGVWRFTQWGELPGITKLATVILTLVGLAVVAAVALIFWLALKLQQLFRNAQRDAVSLADGLKYMANMGRPENGGRRTVENEAEEAGGPPAGMLLEGEAPAEAEPTHEVPDPLDDEPLSGPAEEDIRDGDGPERRDERGT
jgi:hypothetical protein